MAFRYAASAVSCVSLAGSRPGHCDATASTVSVPPAFGPVAFFGAVLPQALAINAIETTADSATKRFLLRINSPILPAARFSCARQTRDQDVRSIRDPLHRRGS